MTQTTVRAIIFDMDGVLTDTEPLWDEVRRGLAADENLPWPDGATSAMQGHSTLEWAQYLIDAVGVSGDARSVADRVIGRLAERYRSGLPTMPGAVDAVRRMASRGPIGLVSSSPRLLIDTVLNTLRLRELFATTVSTEEVGKGKPAPDGYLRACAELGLDPGSCAGVEDSSNGMRAVTAAGMVLIAAPHEFNPPAADAIEPAAVVVGSLTELTDELLDGLAQPA